MADLPNWIHYSGPRRLLAELRGLQNEKAEGGALFESGVCKEVGVTLHLDDLRVWRFAVHHFFPDSAAVNGDIRRLPDGKQHVLLEARFPTDYPASPFMLRVVWPRCVPYTGHVTVGGTVCIHPLTPAGWSSTYTFEAIVRAALHAMSSSDAGSPIRLQLTPGESKVDEYAVAEAEEALQRLIQKHGWEKRTRDEQDARTQGMQTMRDPQNVSKSADDNCKLPQWGDPFSLAEDVNEMLMEDAAENSEDGRGALYAVVGSDAERAELHLNLPSHVGYWNADELTIRFRWDTCDHKIQIKTGRERGISRCWNFGAFHRAACNVSDMLLSSLPEMRMSDMAKHVVDKMSMAIESAPSEALSLPGDLVNVDTEEEVHKTKAAVGRVIGHRMRKPLALRPKPESVLRRYFTVLPCAWKTT